MLLLLRVDRVGWCIGNRSVVMGRPSCPSMSKLLLQVVQKKVIRRGTRSRTHRWLLQAASWIHCCTSIQVQNGRGSCVRKGWQGWHSKRRNLRLNRIFLFVSPPFPLLLLSIIAAHTALWVVVYAVSFTGRLSLFRCALCSSHRLLIVTRSI